MRFRAMETEIKKAVEAGKLSEEEAGRKIQAIKAEMFGDGHERKKNDKVRQREARMKYLEIERKIEAAVKAGKMTGEEADQKLESVKREMFGDREEGRSTKKPERSDREREIGLWLRMAVTDGEMTKEEAREKYKELVGMIGGRQDDEDHDHEGDHDK